MTGIVNFEETRARFQDYERVRADLAAARRRAARILVGMVVDSIVSILAAILGGWCWTTLEGWLAVLGGLCAFGASALAAGLAMTSRAYWLEVRFEILHLRRKMAFLEWEFGEIRR